MAGVTIYSLLTLHITVPSSLDTFPGFSHRIGASSSLFHPCFIYSICHFYWFTSPSHGKIGLMCVQDGILHIFVFSSLASGTFPSATGEDSMSEWLRKSPISTATQTGSGWVGTKTSDPWFLIPNHVPRDFIQHVIFQSLCPMLGFKRLFVTRFSSSSLH